MKKTQEFYKIIAMPPVWLLIGLLMATFAITGCGGNVHELTPVSGKVTYMGAPLTFGCVTFQPELGRASRGAIQPDGTFTLNTPGEGDGAAVGLNKVRITCFESQDPRVQQGGEMGGGYLGKSLIPNKYKNYATSGITVEVKSGSNDPVIIELTN